MSTATNRRSRRDWGVEVVAIPDQPGSLEGLDQTIEFLDRQGVAFRIDPILEPIGFGFAASLEPLSRGPPPLSRGGDDDGRRQPDRADRRRFGRSQHDLGRVLPGTRESRAS